MESHTPSDTARAALDIVADSRSEMADRLVTPWWYHPVLGLLFGGLMAVIGVGAPIIVLGASLLLYCLGIIALARTYRRMTGVWIDGFAVGPRGRRSLIGWIAASAALALIGVVFRLGFDLSWVPVGCGIAIAILTAVWGRRFDEIIRSELREST